MAVCKYCGQEMLNHNSCLPKLIIDGKVYDRIPYGKEKDHMKYKINKFFCPDCECNQGDFHHFNCDIEENPVTHTQLLLNILVDPTISVTK